MTFRRIKFHNHCSEAQSGSKRVELLVVLALSFFLLSAPAHAQFWKNWFKKKPEEKGVLGGKENLEERIKSRTLDDGEDAKPLVFKDSAASDKRVIRKKKPKKKMF